MGYHQYVELFQSKANRDAKVRELKAQGKNVTKTSICNQLVHPQYVKDYQGSYETGFGNTDYKTPFSVLYSYDITDQWYSLGLK